MKKKNYILITAGRGPVECCLAVQGIQNRFKKYLNFQKVNYKVVNQKKGPVNKSMESIVFKIETDDHSIILPWLGSLQWICKSPIRKYHKRKNWFIKCKEISVSDKVEIDINEVTVQTFRASGPGGQHRNKVETAIRLIHRSTGTIVTASDAKSQLQNKKKAWQKLTEKIKLINEQIIKGQDANIWESQLEIERGSPVKTFRGKNFKE